MRPEIETRWIEYFKNNGYPEAEGLDAGMEGAVYLLVPGELVAKVWTLRGPAELRGLREFYRELASHADAIRTPELLKVDVIDGTLVSIERFLHGTPLDEALSEEAEHADPRAVNATIEVLRFLQSVGDSESLRSPAVLDEGVPFWGGHVRWSEAVGALLARRLTRFGDQLRRDVPNLDAIHVATGAFLRSRDDVPMGLIHGDLCGVNIMVDGALRPLSVFDFGFLSTVGDTAFDVSISTAIFNMYGPHASRIDSEVTSACVERLNHPLEVLLSYRAIYSMITSNAYAEDGSDGHYRWCVAMLSRQDVQSALGVW